MPIKRFATIGINNQVEFLKRNCKFLLLFLYSVFCKNHLMYMLLSVKQASLELIQDLGIAKRFQENSEFQTPYHMPHPPL